MDGDQNIGPLIGKLGAPLPPLHLPWTISQQAPCGLLLLCASPGPGHCPRPSPSLAGLGRRAGTPAQAPAHRASTLISLSAGRGTPALETSHRLMLLSWSWKHFTLPRVFPDSCALARAPAPPPEHLLTLQDSSQGCLPQAESILWASHTHGNGPLL